MPTDDEAGVALHAFCVHLRNLHIEAGGPSVDALAADPTFPLRRSQIYDVLKANVVRPPSWDFVQAFIATCAAYAAAHSRPLSITTDRDHWRRDHGHLERLHRDRTTASAPPGDEPAVPQQLPAIAPHFTGRHHELDTLSTLWNDRDGAPVLVSAIAGTAAIGKTALAVRWAHLVRTEFPHGQLYVDLRGYDPQQPVTTTEALAGFLIALGVATGDLPATVEQRAAAFRTRIARRRILLLLDNAASAEQVRPLLPGTTTCAVIVTSRDHLPGLVTVNGARRILLGALPANEATALLRSLIGRRVDSEADAVTTLVAQCCGVPLALRIAAELANSRPDTPLDTLVAELSDTRRRLNLLDSTDDPRSALGAVFSWSYRHLPPDTARAFRLSGLHPGTTITADSLAALTGESPQVATHHLHNLARASLAQTTDDTAYHTHDLLRSYARTLTEQNDSPAERHTAIGRLYDYYTRTAVTADRFLFGNPTGQTETALAGPVTDAVSGRRWLDTERENILRVAAYAADQGATTVTTTLSSALWHHLYTGSHFDAAIALHGYAVHAARHSHDAAGEAIALGNFANAHWSIGRNEDAATHMHTARAIFHRLGDLRREAITLGTLGAIAEALGRYDEATQYYTESGTLSHQAGHRLGEALAIDNLGNIAYRRGDYATATDHHKEALAIFTDIGDRERQATCLLNTATVYRDQGRHQEALRCDETALAIFEASGNRADAANALASIGISTAVLGNPELGIALIRRAIQACIDVGDLPGRGDRCAELGDALQIAGDYEHARHSHGQALDIARETGERRLEAHALNGIGISRLAQRHIDDAKAHFSEAEQVAAAIGDLHEQTRALYGLGRALAKAHDSVAAADRLTDALEIADALDIPLAGEIAAAMSELEAS